MAIFVPRFVRQLRDVLLTAPADGEVLTYDSADAKWKNEAGGGGGGAPTTADYLVGTAQAGLSAEIVAGTSPGGELGGTWSAPTVDATHSGSSHAATQAAAEAASVILAPASSARNVIQPTAGAVIAAIVKAHAAQSVDLTQWQDSAGAVLGSVSELGVVTISPGAGAGGIGLTIIPADYYGAFEPVNRGLLALTFPADPVGSPPAALGYVSLASDTYDPGTYPADRVMGSFAVYSQDLSAIGATTGFVALDGNGNITIAPYGYADVPALRIYDNVANYTFQVSSKGAVAIQTVDGSVPPFVVGIGAGNPYVWWVAEGGHEVLGALAAIADGDVENSSRAQWFDDSVGAPALRFKMRDSAGTLVTGISASQAYVDAHVNDATDAHDASAISILDTASDFTATDVEGALAELQAADEADETALADHLTDATDAHDASAISFSPTGTVAATDVQAAIAEVASEAAAGGIPGTILDAKGDLIAASAADTPTRLAVGTNGHVLTADSGEATGIKWAAAAGGMSATLFDANTILKADSDDTPVALTMGASTILARLAAGSIKAATPAELRTLLDVPTTGEAILDALVDAKGDLLTATAADTPARLAVGTDTHVLTADSAQATGIKWAAAAGGAALDIVPKSGWYFTSPISSVTTGTLSTGFVYVIPLIIPSAFTVDRIGIDVTSLAAGALLRLGIYADDGQNQPGTLILNAGTVDAATTGIKEITISQALTAGVHWLAALATILAPAVRCSTIVQTISSATFASLSGNNLTSYYKGGGNTDLANWSALAGTVANQVNSGAPRVLLRRA